MTQLVPPWRYDKIRQYYFIIKQIRKIIHGFLAEENVIHSANYGVELIYQFSMPELLVIKV